MKLTPIAAIAVALGLLSSQAAVSQTSYPARPIKVLVSVPPGGAPDLVARIVSESLSQRLKQPVVVENRPGSNGNIAADVVAKSNPDGYTLLLGQDSIITINPSLYARMTYDPLKDLVPVASIATNQFVLTINPSIPAKTFQEFLDYARNAKPPLAYASAGNGSQHHLAMEMLKQRAGVDLLHTPYRGGSPATTATVAGETAAMFAGTSSAPQIKSGKLRAIAVTGPERSDIFPELPRIGELYPGYELTIWLGLFAPAGIPADVLSKLRSEIESVLSDVSVRAGLQSAGGLDPLVLSPEEFTKKIHEDHQRYQKLIKEVGVKVD